MFHLGYYWWLVGITNIYQNLGDLTRSGDFTWWVSDCEELVGVTHRGMMGEGDYWEWRTPRRSSDVPEVLSVQ